MAPGDDLFVYSYETGLRADPGSPAEEGDSILAGQYTIGDFVHGEDKISFEQFAQFDASYTHGFEFFDANSDGTLDATD